MLSKKNQNALIDKLYRYNSELARVFVIGSETGLNFTLIKSLRCSNIDTKNKLIYKRRKRHKLTEKAFIAVKEQLQERPPELQISNPKLFNLVDYSSLTYLKLLKKFTQNKYTSPHIHRLCFLANISENHLNMYSMD